MYKIRIYKHPRLGKLLVLDNEIQHVEAWAPLYHEAVVHLPIAFLPEVRNVLILGGGSLYAAAEILKYDSLQRVLLVDHDESVIRLMQKHYPHAKKVFTDKRFHIHTNDAFEWLRNTGDRFDFILNDSVDLINYRGARKANLLKLLCSRLSTNGICSDVVYRHIYERVTTQKTIRLLKEDFYSSFSLIAVPEYPGIFHVHCLWSPTNKNLLEKRVVNRIQKNWTLRGDSPCLYYNPQYLNYYLYFPKYVFLALNNQLVS